MKNHFTLSAWILILVSAVWFSEGGLMTQFAGPFNVVVKQMADCEHPETYPVKIIGNKMRKLNRTAYAYSAKVIIPIWINDKLKLFLSAAKFGNGGWKENYFAADLGRVCTASRMYAPQLTESILRNLNTTCPIPPGNYTLKNHLVVNDFKWPALPYGKYIVKISAKDEDRVIACKAEYVDVVPK